MVLKCWHPQSFGLSTQPLGDLSHSDSSNHRLNVPALNLAQSSLPGTGLEDLSVFWTPARAHTMGFGWHDSFTTHPAPVFPSLVNDIRSSGQKPYWAFSLLPLFSVYTATAQFMPLPSLTWSLASYS